MLVTPPQRIAGRHELPGVSSVHILPHFLCLSSIFIDEHGQNRRIHFYPPADREYGFSHWRYRGAAPGYMQVSLRQVVGQNQMYIFHDEDTRITRDILKKMSLCSLCSLCLCGSTTRLSPNAGRAGQRPLVERSGRTADDLSLDRAGQRPLFEHPGAAFAEQIVFLAQECGDFHLGSGFADFNGGGVHAFIQNRSAANGRGGFCPAHEMR